MSDIICSKHKAAQYTAKTLIAVLAAYFVVLAGYNFFEKCSGESSNGEDAYQYSRCVALSICMAAVVASVASGVGIIVRNLMFKRQSQSLQSVQGPLAQGQLEEELTQTDADNFNRTSSNESTPKKPGPSHM